MEEENEAYAGSSMESHAGKEKTVLSRNSGSPFRQSLPRIGQIEPITMRNYVNKPIGVL